MAAASPRMPVCGASPRRSRCSPPPHESGGLEDCPSGVQALLAYFDCTMLDVGDAHPCHETTTQSPVSATFELLRVALAAFAFLLLRTSSSGGDAHVARLELARLGLAQGCHS